MRIGRNAPLLAVQVTVLAVMIGLVSYSPTLYRMFCAATGYGGTVNRAEASVAPATSDGHTVTVRFDANVAPGLDWEFEPGQRSVEARIGEPTKAYYTARNTSDETIVAHASFNVTPYQLAPYFFKIECFCFTEERLGPGESAKMPLVFYLDEEMLNDKDAADLKSVTLSYTFFKQTGLTAEQIAAARDLAGESETLDAELAEGGKASFANDAPRQ
ncbi:cytochrome c oxidase assembly protein [Amorphus sp. MBR-141]